MRRHRNRKKLSTHLGCLPHLFPCNPGGKTLGGPSTGETAPVTVRSNSLANAARPACLQRRRNVSGLKSPWCIGRHRLRHTCKRGNGQAACVEFRCSRPIQLRRPEKSPLLNGTTWVGRNPRALGPRGPVVRFHCETAKKSSHWSAATTDDRTLDHRCRRRTTRVRSVTCSMSPEP
jgi:hypothetical protein